MRAGLIKIIPILGIIAACTSPSPLPPVRDSDQPPSTKVKTHIVARGETLYSIAWRYNLDFKEIAQINAIGSDYRIYPGQSLSLLRPKKPVLRSPPVASRPASQADRSARKEEPVKPKAQPKVVIKKPNRSIKNSPRIKTKQPVAVSNNQKPNWVWPTKGPIKTRFNGNGGLNRGIDIGGNLGQPIKAASDGTVVYAGSGLRGYGRLIIIKHNRKFLSAYAHNADIYVREGQTVVGGQKIATMGRTGTDSVKLHFEIRYDGKPSDPIRYLPKR